MTAPTKEALRREYLSRRRALDAGEARAADREICRRLIESEIFADAETLLLYASFPDEIDLGAVVSAALEAGKRLAYPRCLPDTRNMIFRYCTPDRLTPGFYGIREPNDQLPAYRGEPALCVVPGIVFDRRGFRIGFGGGYYDRFLADFGGVSVGLVREAFLLDALPHEKFDLPCGSIITERGVLQTEKA